MVKIDTGSDNTDLTANITAGTDAVYMLNTDMGIALGLDFNMVKGKKSGDSMKINYLDIPVSFAYNWVPSADVTSLFAIGPFFGVPLGKWEYDIGAGTAKTKANVAMGLNLENHTTFSINNDFSLGGHVFFKYAFNDLDKDNAEDQTYWSTGLGLSAKFL